MSSRNESGGVGSAEIDRDDLGDRADADQRLIARDLRWLATSDDVGPRPGFVDSVMAAVSREPTPRPLAAVLGATRRRSPFAALAALGDVWRVAFSGGRPLAARLPAIALVVLLVLGSVGLGALGAGAAVGLLGQVPIATREVAPTPLAAESPSVSPSPSPSPSPEPSEAAEPSPVPGATESLKPQDSLDPAGNPRQPQAGPGGQTPRPTDGSSATELPIEKPGETPGTGETVGSGESPGPAETPGPGVTPGPVATQWPARTPGPETPEPSSGAAGE
jgi:hypothetical protein